MSPQYESPGKPTIDIDSQTAMMKHTVCIKIYPQFPNKNMTSIVTCYRTKCKNCILKCYSKKCKNCKTLQCKFIKCEL